MKASHCLLPLLGCLLLGCVFDRSGLQGPLDQGTADTPRLDQARSDLPRVLDEQVSDLRASDARALDSLRREAAPRDWLAPDTSCGRVPSATCWDISGVFWKTNFERVTSQLQIFGKVARDNAPVYAFLDGAQDATYTLGMLTCSYGTFLTAEAWDIERQFIDAKNYKILVRGSSGNACNRPEAALCSGEIRVNAARGWRITEKVTCEVALNDGEQKGGPSHCDVNLTNNTITWSAGAVCSTCCRCGEAALVDIEVLLNKQGS